MLWGKAPRPASGIVESVTRIEREFEVARPATASDSSGKGRHPVSPNNNKSDDNQKWGVSVRIFASDAVPLCTLASARSPAFGTALEPPKSHASLEPPPNNLKRLSLRHGVA